MVQMANLYFDTVHDGIPSIPMDFQLQLERTESATSYIIDILNMLANQIAVFVETSLRSSNLEQLELNRLVVEYEK